MWSPITEADLTELIDNAGWMMDPPIRRLWNRIKVTPTKWQLPPWGDNGGGFWVVALIGQECIYYNDIEEGFNTSCYQVFGHIKDYYCEQFDLLSFLHSYSGLLRKDLNENA